MYWIWTQQFGKFFMVASGQKQPMGPPFLALNPNGGWVGIGTAVPNSDFNGWKSRWYY